MSTNTLIIITGYGSVSPKPTRKAYLNVNPDAAHQRFMREYPNLRSVTSVTVPFEDELTIRAPGDISAY
ncbi:hypothetical protein EQG79_12145 [Spirosoma sordidisoli]|uniref:Uncharacterized protein n=1 Tax=Spirosoma sordidisoli TaxID=2502893 RepID=A0A4Q2UIT2_9BACT|nr:hypothetical protein EQG79_12145 [Spirosoma sordidisoli]